MQLHIPKEGESFKLKEDTELLFYKWADKKQAIPNNFSLVVAHFTNGHKCSIYPKFKKAGLISNYNEDKLKVSILEGTILRFMSIDIKRRQKYITRYYGSWDSIKIDAYHHSFKGLKYKTSQRFTFYFEKENIKLLSTLNLEKIE